MDRPAFPKGLTPVQTQGFGGFAGPVLRNGEVFIFDIAAHHLNSDERLHGGMMMSLASIVLGEVARETAAKADARAATRPLSINCDFVSAGMAGERIEGRAHVTRATRSVLFVSGDLRVGTRILMTATGVYSISGGK